MLREADTQGMQIVVVETGSRPVVGGVVAVWFDEPQTERQVRVRALDPELVWLAHEHEDVDPACSDAARSVSTDGRNRAEPGGWPDKLFPNAGVVGVVGALPPDARPRRCQN